MVKEDPSKEMPVEQQEGTSHAKDVRNRTQVEKHRVQRLCGRQELDETGREEKAAAGEARG